MSDLISREALLEKTAQLSSGWDEYERGKEAVVDCIESAPTVDAVEVVRCGDCERYKPVSDKCGNCFYSTVIQHPTDFCNRGKEKSKILRNGENRK